MKPPPNLPQASSPYVLHKHRRGRCAQRGVQRLSGIAATLELSETQKGGRHQEDAAENLETFSG